MSQPEKSDRPSDVKHKRERHLSGGEELLRGFLMVQETCAEIGNMATPRRFMAFLHCYRQLYKMKKEGIETKQQHLQVKTNTVVRALAIFTITVQLCITYYCVTVHTCTSDLLATCRLIFHPRRSDHVTDALVSLHWLRIPERIRFKIAVLTYSQSQ